MKRNKSGGGMKERRHIRERKVELDRRVPQSDNDRESKIERRIER